MTWKEIKGFEGLYQISEFGDVKSLKKKSIRILKQGLVEIEFKEKIMSTSKITNKTRYKMIGLTKRDGSNKKTHRLIHQLVYENFVGEIKNEYVIDHIDEDRNNNHYSNLQQITQKENVIKYHTKKKLTK